MTSPSISEERERLAGIPGSLDGHIVQFKVHFERISELSISIPTNTTLAGLAALQLLAPANAQTAGELDALSQTLIVTSRQLALEAESIVRRIMDEVVDEHRSRYGDRSWDERASIYRTMIVDDLILERKSHNRLAMCTAFFESIQADIRTIIRVVRNLEAVSATLRTAATLQEVS